MKLSHTRPFIWSVINYIYHAQKLLAKAKVVPQQSQSKKYLVSFSRIFKNSYELGCVAEKQTHAAEKFLLPDDGGNNNVYVPETSIASRTEFREGAVCGHVLG